MEISKGWWEGGQCASISYNATDTISSATQPGGCIATCSGQAKRRMVQRGIDEKKLGRLARIKFQVKQRHTIRFMSACQCGSNAGPSTIYSQQKRFLDKAGIDKHPREVFQEDLINLIKRWMSEGDKIMLAIDINEHILERELSNKL